MATLRRPGMHSPEQGQSAKQKLRAVRAVDSIKLAAGGRRMLTSRQLYRDITSGNRRRLYFAFDSVHAACKAAGVKYKRARKWEEKTIRKELAKARGKRYPRYLRENPSLAGRLTFQQYLKAHEQPLYSAIQDNYARAAAQMGVSRFHAACLDAGLAYASIVARSRSPK